MKSIKKYITLIILLNFVLVTCSHAASNTLEQNSNITYESNRTTTTSNMTEETSNTTSSNVTEETSNTTSSNTTVETDLDDSSSNTTTVSNSNSDDVSSIEKDEVEDYFATIAVEKESITELMEKIEGDKLLDAICNQQTALGNTWMEENRDTFANMNIVLYDGDNGDGAETTAEVSCDLTNNTNTVLKSSDNYVHTGISAACFITKNDGSEIGVNLGEIKISLKGDISGQGNIGEADLSLMQQELVDEVSLENEYYRAADMDTSYEIDVIDLSMLQEYIVNN